MRGFPTTDIVVVTKFSRLFESTRSPVNSMHHQGLTQLGRNILASATADDGLIEAVGGDGEALLVGPSVP